MVQHFQIKEASTKGFPDNKRNTFGAFSITHFQKSLSNLIKWSFTFLKHNEGGLKCPYFFMIGDVFMNTIPDLPQE